MTDKVDRHERMSSGEADDLLGSSGLETLGSKLREKFAAEDRIKARTQADEFGDVFSEEID